MDCIYSDLASQHCFTQRDIVLGYYVIAFSPQRGVSLDIESDHEVPVLALVDIATLVPLMLELHGSVMICETWHFYCFFYFLLDEARSRTRFTGIDYEVAVTRTGIAL